MKVWLELERSVAEGEAVSIAEKELPVADRIEIAVAVVEGPDGLGFDRAIGQVQDDRADLALLISGVPIFLIAVNETGNAEGEQQAVFAQEIERGEGLPCAEVVAGGG